MIAGVTLPFLLLAAVLVVVYFGDRIRERIPALRRDKFPALTNDDLRRLINKKEAEARYWETRYGDRSMARWHRRKARPWRRELERRGPDPDVASPVESTDTVTGQPHHPAPSPRDPRGLIRFRSEPKEPTA